MKLWSTHCYTNGNFHDEFFFKKKQNFKEHLFLEFTNIGFSRENSKQFVNAWKIKPRNVSVKYRLYFLHATGNDCIFPQLSLFENLCINGAEVITFDLDGHGQNSSTEFDSTTIQEHIAMDISTLNHDSQYPSFIMGQSLGGALAIDYLNQTSENIIKAAVFISVPTSVHISSINPFYELSGFFTPTFFSQWKHYGIFGSFPAAGKFRRTDFPIRLSKRHKSYSYKEVIPNFINQLDLIEKAKNILTPSLQIYGSLDSISPVNQGQMINDNLKNGTMYILQGCNHFTTLLSKETEVQTSQWIHLHL